MQAKNPSDDRILSSAQIFNWTGLSRMTVYRLCRAGDFPPPIKLTPSRFGWSEAAVADWLASRIKSEAA